MFAINGVEFQHPKGGFKIERYNVTESERLANGEMAMELIAKKHKFQFTYDAISNADFEHILDLLWYPDEVFFELTYETNGNSNTVTVYVGSIPAELASAKVSNNWIWKGVSFSLIER